MKVHELADGMYTVSSVVIKNRWLEILKNNMVIGKALINKFHNTDSFEVNTFYEPCGGLCKTITHYNTNGFVTQDLYYLSQVSNDSGEDEEEIYFTRTAVQAADSSGISNTSTATQTPSLDEVIRSHQQTSRR